MGEKSVLEVLREARGLIADESRWGRRAYRIEAKGATRFCALGACRQIAGTYDDEGAAAALRAALFHTGQADPNVAHFNDAPSTSHADVLALFDRAIAEQLELQMGPRASKRLELHGPRRRGCPAGEGAACAIASLSGGGASVEGGR